MNKIVIIVLSAVLLSCNHSNEPSIEKSIKETLNKKVNLNIFDKVHYKDTTFSIEEFRKQFDYISIVYLKDGCAPCYPRYIDWHNKMDSIGSPANHTVVFIIEGNVHSSYERFLSNLVKHGHFDNNYFTVIDTNFFFLDGNSEIPYNHISNSLLINKENKIKLIGPPFVNNEMRNLFHRIINE